MRPLPDKLLAEWFWTDRWMGSSAFWLPQEARGVYREMLTQAWRRGACLPNDHEAIRRITATTDAEWQRAWPLIDKYWRVDGACLVNDTQQEIYQKSLSIQRVRADVGRLGGLSTQAKHRANGKQNIKQTVEQTPQAKFNPPSPSPSPSPSLDPISESVSVKSAPKPAPAASDVPNTQETRAAHFCERFAQLYHEHRGGATYYRARPAVDFQYALGLVQAWDDARLERLVIVFLNADEPWINGSTRSIAVFASRASWVDDRLLEWERQHLQAES